MILTCPSCSSRYHVDSAAFTEKVRQVRCANCGHRWKARPPVDAPRSPDLDLAPPALLPQEQVKAAAAPTAVRRPPTRSKAQTNRVGWLLGGGVVVLLLVSAIIGRNGIVGKFPAAAMIYQSMGLSIEQDLGLEFADVTLDWQREGGAFVLVVEGEIVNLSDANQIIPPVRMAILDSEGRELQHEYLELADAELSAGNRINFSGRLVNPIDRGENFRLTFGQES